MEWQLISSKNPQPQEAVYIILAWLVIFGTIVSPMKQSRHQQRLLSGTWRHQEGTDVEAKFKVALQSSPPSQIQMVNMVP